MAITKVSNSVLNLSGNTDALGLPKGTDAQRPTPVAGMLRFNTETSGFEGYDGTEWGAIGGTGSTLVQDEFVGDGTTVAFTLSVSVVAEIFTSVYISGVYQEKNAYSISGTTLTFSVAPPSGASVEVITIDNITVEAIVTSVNGETGAVSLDSDNISEGTTNKYLLDNSVAYNKLGNEFTALEAATSDTLDFDGAQVFTRTLSGTPTLVFQNAKTGMVKDLVLSGDVTITWPTGTKFVSGTYSGTEVNFIQVAVVADGNYWVSISQEQV
jgi:hypothetical protein